MVDKLIMLCYPWFINQKREANTMAGEKVKYLEKAELKSIAEEVMELLRPKRLPVWQIKEVLRYAMNLADWTIME